MDDLLEGTTGNVFKWFSIAIAIGFISWGAAVAIDSRAKAEAIASATDSWSKVIIACYESGQTECHDKFRIHIK